MKETKRHIIRFANQNDEYSILEFIEKYWSENHVFIKSKKLFDWQYFNKVGYNFILGINKNTKEIDSLLGFISPNFFDSSIKQVDYWGAIWKTREGVNPGLGMYLLKCLLETNNSTYSAIGISEIAKEIYTALNFKIGVLSHYYMVNCKFKDFKIAKNIKPISSIINKNTYKIEEVTDIESVNICFDFAPEKSIKYLINRFVKHPIYKYKFYGLYEKERLISIFTIRKQLVGDSSCLRIVDICGGDLKFDNIEFELQKLLCHENSEYIDCLNYGLESSYFYKMGFKKLNFENEIIIPNYFEPFLQANVKIEFATTIKVDNLMFFKADSDQDRPNIIP